MLIYRQEFNLGYYPQNIIQLPNLFTQPQLIISVAGSLSPGRPSNYAGKLQQQIISGEIYFKVRSEVINLDFGYQLFAPEFGEKYQLQFLPGNRLVFLQLSVYQPDKLL